MGTNLTENWPIKISQWPRYSAFLSLWLVLCPAEWSLQPVKDTNMIPYTSRTIWTLLISDYSAWSCIREVLFWAWGQAELKKHRAPACVWVCMHIRNRLQPTDNGIRNLNYCYGDYIGQLKCHKLCFHTADDKSLYSPPVCLCFPNIKGQNCCRFLYNRRKITCISHVVTIVTRLLQLALTKGCCYFKSIGDTENQRLKMWL